MKLPLFLAIAIATIAQIYPAQACLPVFEPLEKRRNDSTIVFQGKIIHTRTEERDFGGSKRNTTLGTVKVTRVIKGKVSDTIVVSHPATEEMSCDHVGTLERLQKDGTVQEFTLGRNGQGVEPEPRVDTMINMWPVGRR